MFFRQSGYTWLVVGLGNPGARYESTRHNMGFLALDRLAEREKLRFNKLRFKAWTALRSGGTVSLLPAPW